jgi:hypothetical protein
MIERVTNVHYPKDVVHEPLCHLRDRAKRPHRVIGRVLTRNRKTRSSASSGLTETSSPGNQ